MKKIKNICSIRNILCFLLVLFVYFVPLVFLKVNKIHYESLKTLLIPLGCIKQVFLNRCFYRFNRLSF